MAELDLNPDTPVPGVAVAEGEAGQCDSRVCAAAWLCVHGLNVGEQGRGFILLSL